MVTWGSNTVHTFGAPAPTPATSFGTPSPAPAPSGLFGSTPPAPAPSSFFGGAPSSGGTSLFGSPAPAPGGSLFGTPSSGSLFGNSAPAPSGSLFGAPSNSGFGTSSSLFGNPSSTNQQQQQQQQQIPAQAALQAHMDASARQEAERVRASLERLHSAYTGTASPMNSDQSNFVAIVYNVLTPEQRQLQWIHGMGNGEQILAPDRPPQVTEAEWRKAVANNPDPQNYMPVALVGATSLQARISWQQERANELASSAQTLVKSHETIKSRSSDAKQEISDRARQHAILRKRLLNLMRRVELARCMNQPIQVDELNALQRLNSLVGELDSARGLLTLLQDKARTQNSSATRKIETSSMPSEKQLYPVLKEHRQKLEKLTLVAQRDERDMTLISRRVATNVSAMHTS